MTMTLQRWKSAGAVAAAAMLTCGFNAVPAHAQPTSMVFDKAGSHDFELPKGIDAFTVVLVGGGGGGGGAGWVNYAGVREGAQGGQGGWAQRDGRGHGGHGGSAEPKHRPGGIPGGDGGSGGGFECSAGWPTGSRGTGAVSPKAGESRKHEAGAAGERAAFADLPASVPASAGHGAPGGAGGNNQSDGGKGSDGYVLVTWD